MRIYKLNESSYRQQKSETGRSKLLFENNEWLVIVPLDKDSSCFYGSDTKWCSAKKFHNKYEEYFYDSELLLIYFINKKTNKKYALVVNERDRDDIEYFDEEDKKIKKDNFLNLIGDIQLKQILDDALGLDTAEEANKNRKKYRESIAKIERLMPTVDKGEHNVELENLLIYTKNKNKVFEYIKTVGRSDNYIVELQFVAVNMLGKSIKFFKNPPEIVVLEAIEQNPRAIKYVVEPSEQMQLAAVAQNGSVIEYIKNPSEKVQLEAVSDDGLSIRFLDNPSDEVKLAALAQAGLAIQFLKNPSEDMQLASVKQNGKAIRYIENPTERVQMMSVSRNGLAVEYIENPSERVQMMAASRNGRALQFFENPSDKVKITALKNNGNAIQFIENPSDIMKRIAVQQNPNSYKFIKKHGGQK
jgi:hypothetical protein